MYLKAGCFANENPLDPVYVGGTQGPCLGVPVAMYDSLLPPGSPGQEVPDGTPGELVATAAFPNVPAFLWGDKTPIGVVGSKYHSAYFARFNHAVSYCRIYYNYYFRSQPSHPLFIYSLAGSS